VRDSSVTVYAKEGVLDRLFEPERGGGRDVAAAMGNAGYDAAGGIELVDCLSQRMVRVGIHRAAATEVFSPRRAPEIRAQSQTAGLA